MAITVATLQAVLDADTRAFDRGIHGAEGTMHKVGHAIGVAAKAAGAAVAVGLGITAKVGWDEFAQGAKVAAQTNAVLKSTGGVANVTAKQVDALAKSIMNKSGMDDEAVKSGENMLLTFTRVRNEVGAGNDIFNQATSILADMSTALGQDMSNSAIQLGKALNDPIRGITALRRVGVSFDDAQVKIITHLVETGKTMDAQKVILRELNKEFGGSAEAAGKTLPGQLAILRETFNNVAGEIVGAFIPALGKIATFVSGTILPGFEDFQDFIRRIFRARTFRARINIAWTGVRDLALDLYDKLKKAVLGETTRKPLVLPSGKILEWDTRSQRGLWEILRDDLPKFIGSVDWSSVGTMLGSAIGRTIKFSADALNSILTTMTEWVNDHISEIAEVGAKILVEIFTTLTDPAFWIKNWKLALVVALSVGSIFTGGFARLGLTAARLLLRPIERIFGPAAARVFARLVLFVAKELGRIPDILKEAFSFAFFFGTISTVEHLIERLVAFGRDKFDWLHDKIVGAINRIPEPFRTVVTKVIGFLLRLLNPIGQITDAIQGAIDKIRFFFQWIRNGIDAVKGPLGTLSGVFGDIKGAVSGLNPFGDGIVSATGAGPSSVSPTLFDDLALANSAGLVLTSGYRPGAITSTGNPSLHGVFPSKAIDVAGSESAMRRFFLLEAARGALTGLREVIHSPYWWHPGAGIQRIPFSAGSVLADHWNHVHVGSFLKGGRIPGPLGAPYLATVHGGETVVPAGRGGGTVQNFFFPHYVGSRRELFDAMRQMQDEYDRRN